MQWENLRRAGFGLGRAIPSDRTWEDVRRGQVSRGKVNATDGCRVPCCLLLWLVLLIHGSAGIAGAGSGLSADAHVSLFYSITHLHPITYLILFIVVVLSVANLALQGWVSRETWPLNRIMALVGSTDRRLFGWSSAKAQKRARTESAYASFHGGNDQMGGVVGAPRQVTAPEAAGKPYASTPLDGLNHPMPRFTPRQGAQTGAPRIVERSGEKKSAAQDFRFSAAVDVPSQEEIGRREREQLVVAGSVTGPDGRAIASSIVYLTDEEGNRIGQSCRSQAETGEFKVLVNEPGKYFLNVYKRGYVLESSDPMLLPIQSGKIEGYQVRMIPEGRIVQGKVISAVDARVVPNIQVKCLCRSGDYSRSTRTNSEGLFRLSGIPINTECFLEVISTEGKVLARTKSFETVQKREIHQDIEVQGGFQTSPHEAQDAEKVVSTSSANA